jgi:hypothetical protein
VRHVFGAHPDDELLPAHGRYLSPRRFSR